MTEAKKKTERKESAIPETLVDQAEKVLRAVPGSEAHTAAYNKLLLSAPTPSYFTGAMELARERLPEKWVEPTPEPNEAQKKHLDEVEKRRASEAREAEAVDREVAALMKERRDATGAVVANVSGNGDEDTGSSIGGA